MKRLEHCNHFLLFYQYFFSILLLILKTAFRQQKFQVKAQKVKYFKCILTVFPFLFNYCNVPLKLTENMTTSGRVNSLVSQPLPSIHVTVFSSGSVQLLFGQAAPPPLPSPPYITFKLYAAITYKVDVPSSSFRPSGCQHMEGFNR